MFYIFFCATFAIRAQTPTGNKALYGNLDPTTLEWTDGIFTKVLREASRLEQNTAAAPCRNAFRHDALLVSWMSVVSEFLW